MTLQQQIRSARMRTVLVMVLFFVLTAVLFPFIYSLLAGH